MRALLKILRPVLAVSSILLLTASGVSLAQEQEPTADLLLEQVRQQLPREPLTVIGELQLRQPKGIVAERYPLEMRLQFGPRAMDADYLIMDAFGRPLERMQWRRIAGSPLDITYSAGPRLQPAEPPAGFSTVQNTDITWTDLTLDFIWWNRGVIIGSDRIKGRGCLVMDVFPATEETSGITHSENTAYQRVRLWIDESSRMVLQAEAYGDQQDPITRLWVKSVTRVDDQWMIKEMDIDRTASPNRTRFRVHRVLTGE